MTLHCTAQKKSSAPEQLAYHQKQFKEILALLIRMSGRNTKNLTLECLADYGGVMYRAQGERPLMARLASSI
jgi:hypothetical protein